MFFNKIIKYLHIIYAIDHKWEDKGVSMDKEQKINKAQQKVEERRRRQKRRQRQQIVLSSLLIVILVVMTVMVVKLRGKEQDKGNNDLNSASKVEITPTQEIEPTVTVSPTPTSTPEPTPTEEPIQKVSGENLHSSSGYLIRVSDKAAMMDKNGSERVYPASLTKIMTVIVALEKLPDLDERVVLNSNMIRELYEKGASMADFVGGENVTVRDLLYGAMLPSGADACVGLAQKITGSEEAFVEMMNQKADELGLKDTHFVTSTGLHDENHYSTCKDMTELLIYALDNENFRTIYTAENYTTSSTPTHPKGITYENTMFKKMDSKELNNGGIIEGGKTGYTSYAGLCLSSLAKVGEEEYILVTAQADGSPDTEQYNITDAFAVYNQIQ